MNHLHADPTEVGKLAERYAHLQNLKMKVDTELALVENDLRRAGLLHQGRPRLVPTHTTTEAREAHRRWGTGERDNQWVIDGERQYQRERKSAQKAAVA